MSTDPKEELLPQIVIFQATIYITHPMKLCGAVSKIRLSISSYKPKIRLGILRLLSRNFGMFGSRYQTMFVSFLKKAAP